ncbi:polyprenyl synthetase family protein [Spirillospora sp. NPDC050679]
MDTPTTACEATDSMARCRDLVQPALREAVGSLGGELEVMCGFALGWWDSSGRPDEGDAGKGLRPALALLGAQAAGVPGKAAVAGAVAVELVHVFSLVHDDIMDGDERRRHRPSVWKAYGVGPAVLVGDALLALALRTLADVPQERSAEATRMLSGALVDLIAGQASDLAFESRPWTGPRAVTMDEYQHMAARKTGALLGCSAAIGAMLAGAPDAAVAALHSAGRHLGLAFQAIDDVLGIWGDPSVTGKPAFSDLRRGKKTVPVLAALTGPPADPLPGPHTDPDRSGRLAALLSGERDEAALRRAAELIEAAGGRAVAEQMARHHLDAAIRELRAPKPTGAPEELIAVANFLAGRPR